MTFANVTKYAQSPSHRTLFLLIISIIRGPGSSCRCTHHWHMYTALTQIKKWRTTRNSNWHLCYDVFGAAVPQVIDKLNVDVVGVFCGMTTICDTCWCIASTVCIISKGMVRIWYDMFVRVCEGRQTNA